ncbi:DOMON-like domain-containing protein [Sphingomonas sp. PB4P5]|uniref:DOMON-like domain-containing protein n=1 Tax=Parasphingomonas puruogangriensis TaxID=3096155 RepID=UPI002FCCB816
MGVFAFDLLPHPDFPPLAGRAVRASGSLSARGAVVSYVLSGEAPTIPSPANPVRTDGLWQTTCFELFVMQAGEERYVELNFSPSGQWAAYTFESYRAQGRDLSLDTAPHIEPIEGGVRAVAAFTFDPIGALRFGLSAVIEETDGTKSYWALAHAPGPPDFHNRDCFIATLPAPTAP